MEFIEDYNVPELIYKPFDKLYLISTEISDNDIKEVLICGFSYDFFKKGVQANSLYYAIIEFPVPVVYPHRFKGFIDSTKINTLDYTFCGKGKYFIASSKEKAKQLKLEYLKSKVKELEELQKDLN
jgi:hypothetical protein